MGGDHGPSVTVPAALKVLAKYPQVKLLLVGDQAVLQTLVEKALQSKKYSANNLEIVHASEQVAMDEPPSQALRLKKDSSMRVAINLVKDGVAGACVSAGNTGALMVISRFVLKTIPGIDRPAIISKFPTSKIHKNVRMLDLGANVDSSPEDVYRFAIMGSVVASAVDNIDNPKVCLLNIGKEEIKGNEQVKQTAVLLSQSKLINYAGFVEGDGIYSGDVDVVVCDGFVGNVALKTTEGVVVFVAKLIRTAFMRNIFTKLVGLIVKPILKPFVKRIDPTRYNGAMFIGLNGTVIKSHGIANKKAFANAIQEAIVGVEKNIPERIRHEVELLLNTPTSGDKKE